MPKGILIPTGRAAELTGISKRTLHRYISQGLLHEDVHFFRGAFPKSPHRWDIAALEERIKKLRNELLSQESAS